MADRINFAVTATPIETITDENSASHDILASEVLTKFGGGGDSLSLAAYNNSAANQGYLNATVNYSTATYSAGGTQLTAIEPDFIFIKNTGFRFADATTLGASSTDVVIVAIRTAAYSDGAQSGWYTDSQSAEYHYFEIAWLQPGQAMLLPLGSKNKSITQFGSNAGDLANLGSSSQYGTAAIMVKTVTSAGATSTASNAVEYLAVT